MSTSSKIGLFIVLISTIIACPEPVSGQSINAARKISLKEAIELALKNNPGLKQADLNVLQRAELEKTAFDPSKLNISIAQSPLEGVSPDNNLGVEQTFSFPIIYAKQAALLKQQTDLEKNQRNITSNELVKNVRIAFSNLLFANQSLLLWQMQDSVLNEFLRIADLRYKTGESSKTEFLSASNRYRQLQLLKQQSEAYKAVALQEMKKLLNSTIAYDVAEEKGYKMELDKLADSTNFSQNPLLSFAAQQIRLNEADVNLQKAGFLPDLNIGYQHQLIFSGWNPENINKSYGKNTRIAGVSLGVGIPIFNIRAQRAKVRAAKLAVEAAEFDYEQTIVNIKTSYLQQLSYCQQLNASLKFYETIGLKEADELLSSSALGYQKGEIDYVAYTQNIEQVFNTHLQYLQTVKSYNIAVISLNYLTGK